MVKRGTVLSLSLSLSVGSWAFGGTIRLISASVRDYNDNTGLCSGRGVRGGAQYPLRGAQVFRVKFFLRRCGSGRDHLLARLSSACTLPFEREVVDNRLPRQRH